MSGDGFVTSSHPLSNFVLIFVPRYGLVVVGKPVFERCLIQSVVRTIVNDLFREVTSNRASDLLTLLTQQATLDGDDVWIRTIDDGFESRARKAIEEGGVLSFLGILDPMMGDCSFIPMDVVEHLEHFDYIPLTN